MSAEVAIPSQVADDNGQTNACQIADEIEDPPTRPIQRMGAIEEMKTQDGGKTVAEKGDGHEDDHHPLRGVVGSNNR